jgi:hypothetical protein
MAKRAAFHSGSPGVSLSSSTSRASCHVAPPQIVAAPTATSIFDMGMASCARSFVCARVCVCVCIGAHDGRALLLLYEKMIVLGSCAPVGLLCVGACGECTGRGPGGGPVVGVVGRRCESLGNSTRVGVRGRLSSGRWENWSSAVLRCSGPVLFRGKASFLFRFWSSQ